MKQFLLILTLGLAFGVFASVGQAGSPAQDCAALDGVYVHDGPNSTCVIDTQVQVGQSDNTKGTTTVTTGPGKSDPNSDTTTCTGITNPSGPHCK